MSPPRDAARHSSRFLWLLLIAIVLVRLASLGSYPLADTTEARYGNVARLMAATGNWITPHISPGVPFWGKPPLSFWLSAGSLELFGVNEFAARLPFWLLGIAVSALLFRLAARERDRHHAVVSLLILNSSALFWISSGAVMTDHALLTGTTLSMVGFWLAMRLTGHAGTLWGYGFFAGLAIGLLAKGPVALVLTALPLGVWALVTGRWREVWRRIPWAGGALLTVLLALPWYWLAETRTPGFLEYFVVGEHWKRFLEPGWRGDLYGTAHLEPRGTIWLYWLKSTLPWSLVLPLALLRRPSLEAFRSFVAGRNQWFLYLLCWASAPMVFFTVARNVLPAYVLPGLPAFALLAAQLAVATYRAEVPADRDGPPMPRRIVNEPIGDRPGRADGHHRLVAWTASFMLLLFTLAVVFVALGNGPADRSQKELVAAFQKSRGNADGRLVYLFERPYSAAFYSDSEALTAETISDAEQFLTNEDLDYFAIDARRVQQLPASFQARLARIECISRYCLLRESESIALLRNTGGEQEGRRGRAKESLFGLNRVGASRVRNNRAGADKVLREGSSYLSTPTTQNDRIVP